MPRLTRHPRGAILMAVLVSLAVAVMVYGSLVRSALHERDLVRMQQWKLQAAWLAQSGLDRAAARLAHNPQYAGEQWAIPAEQLRGEYGAVVEIEVISLPQAAGTRRIQARAAYPDPAGSPYRIVQHTAERVWDDQQ